MGFAVDKLGLPDIIVNVPSMPIIYVLSVGQEMINTPFAIFDAIFKTDTVPFDHSH